MAEGFLFAIQKEKTAVTLPIVTSFPYIQQLHFLLYCVPSCG